MTEGLPPVIERLDQTVRLGEPEAIVFVPVDAPGIGRDLRRERLLRNHA